MACFGVVTRSLVLDSTFSADPAAEPNTTLLTLLKFFPVTVTRVPPVSAPEVGDTFATTGLGVAGAFDAADGTDTRVGAADATDGPAADSAATTAHARPNPNSLRRLTEAP